MKYSIPHLLTAASGEIFFVTQSLGTILVSAKKTPTHTHTQQAEVFQLVGGQTKKINTE